MTGYSAGWAVVFMLRLEERNVCLHGQVSLTVALNPC
eukprot:COSAG02_NODE_53621_length_300_cov_1.447761_1_plen_36_part_10